VRNIALDKHAEMMTLTIACREGVMGSAALRQGRWHSRHPERFRLAGARLARPSGAGAALGWVSMSFPLFVAYAANCDVRCATEESAAALRVGLANLAAAPLGLR
jgi:hypothetical protein